MNVSRQIDGSPQRTQNDPNPPAARQGRRNCPCWRRAGGAAFDARRLEAARSQDVEGVGVAVGQGAADGGVQGIATGSGVAPAGGVPAGGAGVRARDVAPLRAGIAAWLLAGVAAEARAGAGDGVG